VKLVPINARDLALDRPMPFSLRDAEGRLLLAAGLTPADDAQRAELMAQLLYADEHDCAQWRRRLAAAMDERLREGAVLHRVASARPDDTQRDTGKARVLSTAEAWFELRQRLDGTLRDVAPGSDWRQRLLEVHAKARVLAARKPDESLYHLVFETVHYTEKYSAHHALMSLCIAELSAAALGWPQAWIDSLGRAALTMNVAMRALQDLMASSDKPLTLEHRAEIDAHASLGASQLAEAGLGDALAIEVVALHHDPGDISAPLGQLPPARQLARLLRRVDIFGAKISRRATRQAMSPLIAAREACLGPDGQPDEVGGAMLKVMGVYPPGSFVELSSGEVGVVVARGRRVNTPYVAALVAASGTPLPEPLLRDTLDRRHAVKGAVAVGRVRLHVPHDKVLALPAPQARVA
jgi:HD-GYP domain-containing protein (c-di-GMP phosphodiesterase class II)